MEIVIDPLAIYAFTAKDLLPIFQVSLQTYYTATGALTGKIAADVIADMGIPWVITGHSERRSIFKETDKDVVKKITYAISTGLSVIACIGELLEECEAGLTMEVTEHRISGIATTVSNWSKVVTAYEPV